MPHRLLILLPSWVGDAVMATLALRLLRGALPGAFMAGLVRPGLDGLLDGTPFLDEIILDRAGGMMGHKRLASRLRHLRFDTAILFTNSFSTALVARLAGIPRRVGYDRDARGLLLTDKLHPPIRRDTPPFDRSSTAPSDWAPIPACEYYFNLARHFLASCGIDGGGSERMGPLELHLSDADRVAADLLIQDVLESPSEDEGSRRSRHGRVATATVPDARATSLGSHSVRHSEPARAPSMTEKDVQHVPGAGSRDRARSPTRGLAASSAADRLILLNPGGNDAAKRWPEERFAALAGELIERRGAMILLSGAPAEAGLTARIHSLIPGRCRARAIDVPSFLDSRAGGVRVDARVKPLSLLKALIARCSLMVTNDTGPRHIAAALGVPVVTLFGPTDHRWTTIPFERERRVLADPTLPEEEVANDHPRRCSMDRIRVASVMEAVDSLLPPGGHGTVS